MTNFKEIHRRTIEVYEAHAKGWDAQRPKHLFEKNWLDQFISCLNSSAQVLDVGCGTAEPIAQYLIEKKINVTGIDASQAMIDISKLRYPEQAWFVMDMRSMSLSQIFDGIIAWDSFFHLNPDEQRETLQLFFNHLNSSGVLLLTIGDKEGEVLGVVDGQQVYHSSLEPDEYREILRLAGFENVDIVFRDKECGEHSVLLASGYQTSD